MSSHEPCGIEVPVMRFPIGQPWRDFSVWLTPEALADRMMADGTKAAGVMEFMQWAAMRADDYAGILNWMHGLRPLRNGA